MRLWMRIGLIKHDGKVVIQIYINLFWAGVLTTILAEVVACVIYAVVVGGRKDD